MARANCLVIMVDEMQAAALSCAGHPIVRTPHLDALAARGCRFSNAYTPSPICVPARAAFATGQYVHRTGHWDNAHPYDGRVRGWGHLLQEAGIAPVSIGKLHYRTDADPTGFTRQIRPLHVKDGVGQVWGSIRDPLPVTKEPTAMMGPVGAGVSATNAYDMAVAADAADWIGAVDRAAPWVLFCSFVAPHFPLTVPAPYLDLYPAAQMPGPDLRPADGYRPHPWLARMEAFAQTDAEFASDADRKAAVAAYYALCTFVDAQVGRVLAALADSGQQADTLVIFCSDHGETLGRRGRWGKSVLYGEATRIPMIVAGPGVTPGVCATPVSLLDVAPTIAEAFDLPPPGAWEGTSLRRIAARPADPDRVVFSEYHAVASPSAGFRVTDARWAYHHYVGYRPELFDLAADPRETVDLAADPAHAAIRDRMAARLHAICDPVAVDAAAKADQAALIARHGGPAAAAKIGPQGATPVPG